eukprot:gene18834-24615_t
MTIGTVGGAVTGFSLPIFNVLFGKILDALNKSTGGNSFESGIKSIVLDFVYVAIANLFSGYMQVACWSIAGERQTQKLRELYVRAILSQEIGWFDTVGAGELSTRTADIIGKVQDGIGRKVGDLTQYIAQFIGSFVVGLYLCWKLTVVLLASFPLIGGAGAFMIAAVTAAQTQSLEQYSKAGGIASEALSSIRTVSSLNAQTEFINKYRYLLLDAMQVGIFKGLNLGFGNGLLFCACFFTYALGFWYGGQLVADDLQSGCSGNCITGGTILAVFFSVIMGSIAMGQIAPPMAAFTSAVASTAPLFDVINRKPLIDGLSSDGIIPQNSKEIKGQIELKKIEFAYPSRPNLIVCKGYDLVINSGETVALVGPSGCGKSTVINLLLRFYDPQGGSVLLDGMDIKTLNTRWLRSKIGYVGQEPVLFSGTIADNIAYGIDKELIKSEGGSLSPETLHDMVVTAAKQANAHEFIMSFPDGYQTDVGSNGIAMSGGQKQRIAIARALVRRPAVLLLDEATSALDAASERLVQESIDLLQASKSQTTIIIAHRLSTIRNADKIAVLNQGKVVELGKHDELIALNGLYADLISLQVTTTSNESESFFSMSKVISTDSVSNEEKYLNKFKENKDNEVDKLDVNEKPQEITTEAIDKEEEIQVKKRIWELIYQHKIWFILGLSGAATFGAVFPVWGLLLADTQHMFYYKDGEKIKRKAAELAIYYIIIGVIALVSATFQFWGVAQVGERISLKIRSDLFESLMRREISFFDYEENNIGALTTRLADDSRTVHKATGEALAKQLQAIFTLLIGLGLGLSASWKIALVVLATFPINIAASAIQMQAIAGQQYDHKGSDASHGSIISTAFTHMRTVSAFSMQYHVADEYTRLTGTIMKDRIKRSHVAGIGFGGAQTSLFLTYALLFWYGSTLIKSGDVSFQDMMTAILTLMLGALGLGQAMTDIGDQKEGVIAAKRVFQAIQDGKNSLIDGLSTFGLIPPNHSRGRIELKNVFFRYPTRPKMKVCRDYNLVIEPGEVVALVGPSGSGKSTIMNLLLRFYDPYQGELLLDGANIKDVNIRWLRSQIGYVGQEPVLFSGSIAENVAKGRATDIESRLLTLEEAMAASDLTSGLFGKSKTSETKKGYSLANVNDNDKAGDIEMGNTLTDGVSSDIIDACKQSNAHDFIMTFPNGYHTDVGEGSIMVSGGQKQRIAIARALIRRPAVLLLDEATSALDAASEQLVQQSIDALQASKSQTTIVIAHRLTTIKNADKIAVIDNGKVVEIGKHDELLAMNGLYTQLWEKQNYKKVNNINV